ncbi:hypothetical protein FRC10_000512 [Ceratobasidium sp. 414]|nr:hypothetical protein FRC10_000512 [Ceratobasidium sp. 414]
MPSSLPPRTPTTASVLTDPNLPEVVELMSYHKGIRGRATVVLRVREVTPRQAVPEPEPETQGGVDTAESAEETEVPDSRGYVLKLMWSESEKRLEGEVLGKLVGIYRLAQHLWHSNVLKAKRCLDATLDRDEGPAGKNLTNLDIVLNEKDSKEAEYYPGDYSMMHPSCPKRVYCQPLTPTVGEPLWTADSPRNLLEAVLGAILGYWSIFNEGMLCQDMNDGNVLMLQEGQRFDCRKRKGRQPPPCKHHFLDDLESFFWLILWTTITHLDPQVRKRTSAALRIINGLDQHYLVNIYAQKRTLLSDCDRSGGRSIKKQLAAFGNAWAKDSMIVSVIVDLGSFFYKIDDDDLDNPDYEPDVVFPHVIDTILKALGV